MGKTAVQDLKQDLQETFNTANDALMAIESEEIRLACQEVVRVTIKNIIDRIDNELLEIEKQQLIDFWIDGNDNEPKEITTDFAEQYYNEKYNK